MSATDSSPYLSRQRCLSKESEEDEVFCCTPPQHHPPSPPSPQDITVTEDGDDEVTQTVLAPTESEAASVATEATLPALDEGSENQTPSTYETTGAAKMVGGKATTEICFRLNDCPLIFVDRQGLK